MFFNLFSAFWLERSAQFGPNKAGLVTKIQISQDVKPKSTIASDKT
jgi:hypothetical protein